MKERSTFKFLFEKQRITTASKIGFIGSCFSERMQMRFETHQYAAEASFFGTLFNPVSIFNHILNAIEGVEFNPDLVVTKDGQFVHYDCYSRFNEDTKENLLLQLKSERERFLKFLKEGSHFFITLGSAYAYMLKSDGVVVANCHKQNQKLFDKVLLPQAEIVGLGKKVIEALASLNPTLQIHFTISPVKHLRDGVVNNKLSKSLLRVICQEYKAHFPSITYIPVLEWVEEDLRDYTYYKPDLAHPNELAEEYIWNQLCNSLIA